MKILIFGFLVSLGASATCLSDEELKIINTLDHYQLQEFLIDKQGLQGKECADIAEGIDFSAIEENLTLNKGGLNER
jgi:hypothetical protein